MIMNNDRGDETSTATMAGTTASPDELRTLADKIESALEMLAQKDAELDKAERACTRAEFSLEKQISRVHTTIADVREAITHHRAVIMKVGEVCAEGLRLSMRLKDSGAPARAVLKKKELTAVFLLNVLVDEYYLGHLSQRSKQSKRILAIRETLKHDTRQAEARRLIRVKPQIIRKGDVPEFGPAADWLLSIFAKPSSCRKLGRNAYVLTMSIVRIASLLIGNGDLYARCAWLRIMVFSPIISILFLARARLYGQPHATQNTRDRLYYAKVMDKSLSSLLGSPTTIKTEYTHSRHEMQKCRVAVSLLFDDILSVGGLTKESAEQSSLFYDMLDERNALAAEIRKDMDLYDSLCTHHTQKDVAALPVVTPTTPPEQSVPTKYRRVKEYHSRNKTEPAYSVEVLTPDFLVTQESKQWKADLAELTDEQRTLFTSVAQTIPRSQARKPLGRSNGRVLFTLPVGDSHRLVYSIDAGIAVLERAFGLASHAEDYRKFRKDIQKAKR